MDSNFDGSYSLVANTLINVQNSYLNMINCNVSKLVAEAGPACSKSC